MGNWENLSKYRIRLKGPDEFTEKRLHNLTYLYNVEYVSEAINWPLAIENVLRLFCPDLLINCFHSETSIVEFKPEELFIFVGQKDMHGDSAHFSVKENQIFLLDPSEEESRDLFNKTLEFFN